MNSGEKFLERADGKIEEILYGLVTLGNGDYPQRTIVETSFQYIENEDEAAVIVSNGMPDGKINMTVAELEVAKELLEERGYEKIYVKGSRLRRIETEMEVQKGREKILREYGRVFGAVPLKDGYEKIGE